MHAHLFLLSGALLLAPQMQPRAEKLLSGPFGIAQEASLNQVDILVELARHLSVDQTRQLQFAIHAVQRAHDAAVRNLIVVEFGAVTADYRRWKLRRAIQALMRADREREQTLARLLREASSDTSGILVLARDRTRAEAMRAVSALRALDGGTRYGGAGATSAGNRQPDEGAKQPGSRRASKTQGLLPAGSGGTATR
jgi:hypothetical protein